MTEREDFQILNAWNKYVKRWPWFILSIVICCGVAFLYLQITPKEYVRTASVMINEDNGTGEIAAAFSDKSQFKASTNVNNEIVAFGSLQLTQEVVKRLNLNIYYLTKQFLTKKVDLYDKSPITVLFQNSSDQDHVEFNVKILPDSMAVLSNFIKNVKLDQTGITVKLNTIVSTPVGELAILPTLYYSADHPPVDVVKRSIKTASLVFSNCLEVSLLSKENTIIKLEMSDESIQRADDFLNTLIDEYNKSWLDERNKATISTMKSINDKIPLIEQELKAIDDTLEQYKSTNLLADVRDAASLYMKESNEYSAKAIEVRNQLSIAHYIQKILNDKNADLLPTNIGLNNQSVESSINQYNAVLLKRNELLVNSGQNNPVIQDMNSSLDALRKSIVLGINNLVNSLNLQLTDRKSVV